MTNGDLPPDHPFSSSAGPANMRAALNDRVRTGTSIRGDRVVLADAMRQVIDAMMRSTEDGPQMQAAAALVAEAASLLGSDDGERTYVGVAEGALAKDHSSFIDFSPFIGVLNPLAPPIVVSFDETGDGADTAHHGAVTGTCTYGAAYEGPPGCVHGGFIAAGFDEVLGFAQAASGTPGMTGSLNISYRSPTPLGREVRYVGRLDRVEGRKIFCSATLHHGDTLCAEAEGLFISMKPEVFERLLRLRLGNQD